jgi:hypothetical protein
MEQLIQAHGEKDVVAMVLLLAYANFQDRLILALGITPAVEAPLPPVEVLFRQDPEALAHVSAVARTAPATIPTATPVLDLDLQRWQSRSFTDLQNHLERQRSRSPRIRTPAWDEVKKYLPKDRAEGPPLQVRWTLVCVGYQPELANGWLTTMRTFATEARRDRVFDECLFWVVTRTNECFY